MLARTTMTAFSNWRQDGPGSSSGVKEMNSSLALGTCPVLIQGSTLARREWTTVEGSAAVQVYADVRALHDDSFETKERLCGIARRDAGDGAVLVSGPSQPLEAPAEAPEAWMPL